MSASGHVYTSNNANFHENTFPFAYTKSNFFTSTAPTQKYTSTPFFLPCDTHFVNSTSSLLMVMFGLIQLPFML